MKLYLTKDDYIETDDAIDLSIPVNFEKGITAWYLGRSKSEIVRSEKFVGSIAEGGAVNFRDIYFNPHAHCTHKNAVDILHPRSTPLINKTSQLSVKQFFVQ